MTLAAVVLELVLALVQAVVLVSSDAGRGGVGSSTKGARRQNEGGKSDDAENVDATFCLAARHLQDHHVRLPAKWGLDERLVSRLISPTGMIVSFAYSNPVPLKT